MRYFVWFIFQFTRNLIRALTCNRFFSFLKKDFRYIGAYFSENELNYEICAGQNRPSPTSGFTTSIKIQSQL